MKVLIAIASCVRDCQNGFNSTIRATWLKDYEGDYGFFVGKSEEKVSLLPDEVVLDCKDDYLSLPEKTHRIMEWAWHRKYDYVFKCDTDTYVRLLPLLSSGFQSYDYMGAFNGHIGNENAAYGRIYAWASGGSGYWLSRRAAGIVYANPPDERAVCPILRYPCEDLWIGQLLGPLIQKRALTGFSHVGYNKGFREDFKTAVTSHYCSEGQKRVFDPSWMVKHHAVAQGKSYENL